MHLRVCFLRLAHCTPNYLRKESRRYITRPLSYELLHEKQRALSREKHFEEEGLGRLVSSKIAWPQFRATLIKGWIETITSFGWTCNPKRYLLWRKRRSFFKFLVSPTLVSFCSLALLVSTFSGSYLWIHHRKTKSLVLDFLSIWMQVFDDALQLLFCDNQKDHLHKTLLCCAI